jgi:mannose-6-phosphate isomerase
MSADYDPSQFDPKTFIQEGYTRRIEKPWGYEIHWAPADMPYMGKIIHVKANNRLSLQVHDQKQETMLLINGRAKMIWENENGELTETEMELGKGYTCQVGQRHRLCGITDCDVAEVSTPEIGTTWRLEDDYKRPDETEEQREKERENM